MNAEYTILLVLVSLVMAVTLAGLTVPLVQYHRDSRDAIIAPVP